MPDSPGTDDRRTPPALRSDAGSTTASEDAGTAAPPPASNPPADPCMGLDYLGTCQGTTAAWCENGALRSRDCTREGLGCGWVNDSVGYYCGGSGTRPDPGTTPPPPDPPPPTGTDAGTAPPPGPTGECGMNPTEEQELAATNADRAGGGLPPLACDATLVMVARAHSQDMCDRGFFDHNSLDGRSPFDRMEQAGVRYGTAGENIAAGQQTSQEVNDAWMSSPGHRANIMNGDYRRIGIGYVACGGSPLWTQDFTD